MFSEPHTPLYQAVTIPPADAPRTSTATRPATIRVRITANRYGSGIRRST